MTDSSSVVQPLGTISMPSLSFNPSDFWTALSNFSSIKENPFSLENYKNTLDSAIDDMSSSSDRHDNSAQTTLVHK